MSNPTATTENKQILIATAGSGGKYQHVEILPATKVADVLNKLGLTGVRLQKPDGALFSAADNLFDQVRSGQKLFVSPEKAEAGLST